MEDDEETSEVSDAPCFLLSSAIIYYFLSGTHSYIDGTKNLANMKKRLRYQLPRTPLKVLKGEKDEEDIMDKYYERFKAPTSTSEDDDNDNSTDGYSTRSSLPRDETGDVSEEWMARYLGSSLESINPIDDVGYKQTRKHQRNNRDNQSTSSISHEAIEMQVLAQVHHPPDTDSSDDDATRKDNDQVNKTGYQTTGSISHEATEMQVLAQIHHPAKTDSDDDGPLTDDATTHVSNGGSERSLVSEHRAAQSDTDSHNGDGNLDFDQVNQTAGSGRHEVNRDAGFSSSTSATQH